MNKRYMKITLTLVLCILIFACASSQQTYVTKVTDGEPLIGESVGYIYKLDRKATTDLYILLKRKYCFEEIEKVAHERTRAQDARGAAATVLLPLQIAFPRVGTPVISTGFEKSRGEQTETIGAVKTGRIIPCGDYIPAPGEKIVLMTSESKIIRNFQTNKNGILDLTSAVASEKNAVYINVFIDQKDSAYFVATTYTN